MLLTLARLAGFNGRAGLRPVVPLKPALAALDEVSDEVGAGRRGARAVAARVLRRQVDRLADLRRPDRPRTDPGDGQVRLALEEPLRPYAAGRPPLRRVQRERGDLGADAGRGDDHRLAVL